MGGYRNNQSLGRQIFYPREESRPLVATGGGVTKMYPDSTDEPPPEDPTENVQIPVHLL